jgi:hypothetical protein
MDRQKAMEIFDRNTIRAEEYRKQGRHADASYCQKTANMALSWLHQHELGYV